MPSADDSKRVYQYQYLIELSLDSGLHIFSTNDIEVVSGGTSGVGWGGGPWGGPPGWGDPTS